jgi:hypothetical protein
MDRLPPMDSPPLSTNSNSTLERLSEAKKGAIRLLGCYRTGDANDPETYISAVVSVLSRYAVHIIRDVTEPATGLPGRLKWLPTVAEIREECEILAQRDQRKFERERQIMAQLEAREALQITDGRPKKTYEQLVAECRAVGIMIGPKGPAQAVDVAAVRQKYGISQADWDAIPNAKGAA